MARTDLVGLFWEDVETAKRGGPRAPRTALPVPESDWRPPTYFPNLKGAPYLSIDVETYDPELGKPIDNGPGWARGIGHIVGVSVGAPGGYKWYFPMRHEIEPEYNMDPQHVLAWCRDMLGDNNPKIGANITYDVGWLQQEGVYVGGDLLDVQFAEAVLHEAGVVNLEHLGQKYLKEGKESNELYRWLADSYGGKADGTARKNIYRASPRTVGPYAESDADLPLRIIKHQYPLLAAEGLLPTFQMECKLIRMMIAMRFRGVKVNLERAEKLQHELKMREKVAEAKLNDIAGSAVDVNSASSLARAFDSLGIPYGKTEKGNPSFGKETLEATDHPFTHTIKELKNLEKLRGTFVESYILNSHVNGRVFGQFHQLRGDESGTRSGRFSSSNPNLQNIPSRDEELAPLVRGLFVPDDGFSQWYKGDYGQIEYRFLVHYAQGQGAEEVREMFRQNPGTDYHEIALDMVAPFAGWDITTKALRKHWRKPIKNINFGLAYGMGQKKLANDLGLSKAEGKALFQNYHRALPFVQATMDWTSNSVERDGYIATILGRRSRFDLWEPVKFTKDTIPLPYEKAVKKYGEVRRAGLHKSLNRKLQGSAADLMKMGMLTCWESGIFDVLGIPQLTVHDELDGSYDPTPECEQALKEMTHIMETAIPLSIPIKFEVDTGTDWGHCS